MAAAAASAVVAAARVLYATVQQVKANKEQARVLADRVRAVVEPVRAFDAARLAQPETEQALALLLRVLNDANAFLAEYRDTGRVKRVLFKGSHSDRLAQLQAELGHAAQALALGLAVQSVLSMEEARAVDARADVWTIAPTVAVLAGRAAALDALAPLLRPAPVRAPATRIAVSGMGGTGKSTLAQYAAALHAARFTSGWVLDGSNEATLAAGLQQVADDLGLGDATPDRLAASVRSDLSKADRAGWLVLVDNVDDARVAETLPALLPSVGGCVLVTSRLASWERASGWTMLTLSALPLEDAASLLRGGEPTPVTGPLEPAIDAIALALGGLPLALAHARAYTRRLRLSWPDYLAILNGEGTHPGGSSSSSFTGGGGTAPVPAVAAAAKGAAVLESLRLSLQAAVRELSADAVVPLLQVVQVLHPDDIPRVILADLWRALYPPGSGSGPDVGIHDVLAVLADLSVLHLTETTASTHRLMQQAMAAVAPVDRACILTVATALNGISASGIDIVLQPKLAQRLVVHYGVLLQHLERECAGSATLGAAYFTLGNILFTSSLNAECALRAFQQARDIQERVLADTDPQLVLTKHGISTCVACLGKYEEALTVGEGALTSARAAFAPDNPVLALIQCTVGGALLLLGRYSEAEASFSSALVTYERTFGPQTYMSALVLTQLATAASGQGRPAQQLALLERAYPILASHFGPDSWVTLNCKCNLGQAAGELGEDHRGQFADVVASVDQLEQVLGPEHYAVAAARYQLAKAYGRASLPASQLVTLQRAHTFYSSRFGETHRETARTLARMGEATFALRGIEGATAALTLLESALPLLEQTYGVGHPEVAWALASVGEIGGAAAVAAAADPSLAIAQMECALESLQRTFGKEHVYAAQVRTRLGGLCVAAGEVGRAGALLEQALVEQAAVYGEDAAEVAVTRRRLAVADSTHC